MLLAIGRVSVSVKCGVLDTLSGEDEISQVLIKSLNPLSSLILVLEISDSEAWVGWRGGASEAGISLRSPLAAFTGYTGFFNPSQPSQPYFDMINLIGVYKICFLTN